MTKPKTRETFQRPSVMRFGLGMLLALVTTIVVADLQTLHADTFILNDGTTIEGAVVRGTKSSIAIRRTIGGLRLVRLSRIEEVQIDRPGKPPLIGPLVSWLKGTFVIEVEDNILEVRDGEILSETRAAVSAVALSKLRRRDVAKVTPALSESSATYEVPSEQSDLTVASTVPGSIAQIDAQETDSSQPVALLGSSEPAAEPEPPVDRSVALALNADSGLIIHASVAPAKEGESIVFNLQLSRPAERPLVIIYTTLDGTAKVGADYEAQRGVASFQPGVTSTEIRTSLLDDDIAESDEQFRLFLTVDPSLATLRDRQVTATIIDDD